MALTTFDTTSWAMGMNDAAGKRLVKKARADAAKWKGGV